MPAHPKSIFLLKDPAMKIAPYLLVLLVFATSCHKKARCHCKLEDLTSGTSVYTPLDDIKVEYNDYDDVPDICEYQYSQKLNLKGPIYPRCTGF